MSRLPTGTVTFLFTDIEGSTQLWEKYPQEMRSALAQHDSILREGIALHNGHIIKSTGDGVHAVFEKAADAIAATLDIQRKITTSQFCDNPEFTLRVRMGVHSGEAELRDGDYFGQALNRSARIMSLAYGGQILLSSVTAELAHEQLAEYVSLQNLGEHRLKDLSRVETIFQLSAPGLVSEFPALRSLTVPPNNLPVQLTSFIGRNRELAEATSKLENVRLLTLIGPGGTGKTRLSLKLGMDLLHSFRDGVWLAELAPLTDPEIVLQTIAAVLNVREQPGMPLQELVINYLRDKHLLLILDNCEHLVDKCAQMAGEFLHTAQELKILASSREALGISGEAVYRVPSLSLPEQTTQTPEAMAGFESIQLFTERATAANPSFRLTDDNASSVAQICHRLDGIPLAIELAASRLKVFSPEEIAVRLDDRFKLLTGGSRTALPRQQTLRALIDWSYDLLSTKEQALLRRLSVFAGGWSYDAGEAICYDPFFLDDLTQLINKSLVILEEGDKSRYRLLETIRQYARDKLLESGEGFSLRNKHLDYYMRLAETAGQNILGSDALSLSGKLRAEHDNIRAALGWSLSENIESALRIVAGLPYFWITNGFAVEGHRWAVDVLDRAKSAMPAADVLTVGQMNLLANAYLSLAIIATDQGDNEMVLKTAGQSISLARLGGDLRILAVALAYLAAGKANLGESDEAFPLAQEALAAARDSGDLFAIGFSLTTMGEVTALAKYDYAGALAYAEESIAFMEKYGYRWGYSMTVFGLGFMAKMRGEYDQARARFHACLPIFKEIGDSHRVNMVQSELAHMEREQGRTQQAIQMYRQTIREWQRLGHRAAIAHQLECFAFIAKAQEQGELAVRLLGAAEALREKINIAMTPLERVVYEREVTDLRENTSETELSVLWAEGRLLTMEQAIQLSLRL